MKDKLKWFKDAKYGLFIHWGLYAIPGGEWEGRLAPHGTEWLMRNLQVPLADYKKLAERFNPVDFDPYYYVRKAKRWGMKYIVVTAKHHDGFAMYDTKVSDYSVMNTPYGKDIIRQFADACAAEGMTFCVYYSQMQDWEDPNADGNTWDFDPAKKEFKRYFYNKCIPQVKELLTNYGPIGLIWFDTPYEMPKALCQELADVVHECQPACLVNGRVGYGIGDYRQAADNSIPRFARNDAWECPMTLNATWGYSHRDSDFKAPSAVLENLVRVVGKGGNLLLNVGPDEYGKIPEASAQVLDTVGEWLAVNGKSIYNTVSAPDFPYLIPWGEITYNEEETTLFFHIKKYPTRAPYQVHLAGLKNRVEKVTLLADGSEIPFKQSYETARDECRFNIFMPAVCPDADDTVVAVKLDGKVEVQKI
ncbi:MAG: alpha-L-fucosidase [Clostridia bacterium]|nr:alpha-L-fucosidase [Clostridia bacterium]